LPFQPGDNQEAATTEDMSLFRQDAGTSGILLISDIEHYMAVDTFQVVSTNVDKFNSTAEGYVRVSRDNGELRNPHDFAFCDNRVILLGKKKFKFQEVADPDCFKENNAKAVCAYIFNPAIAGFGRRRIQYLIFQLDIE